LLSTTASSKFLGFVRAMTHGRRTRPANLTTPPLAAVSDSGFLRPRSMTQTASSDPREQAARNLLWGFTAAAAATGAIPVPATSAAIVAENAALIGAVASAMGQPVDVSTVVASLGVAGAINMIARAVFVEAARALGWFAGPGGVAAVCALGATTAALQTWCVGHLTIAVARRGGFALAADEARKVLADARATLPSVADLREHARSRGRRAS